jgi:hypothetical protein
MSGHDRRPSVPAWTPLAAAGEDCSIHCTTPDHVQRALIFRVASHSTTGSSESRSPSQEMQQDELAGETPSPLHLPQIRSKRKGVESRTSRTSTNKKARVGGSRGQDDGMFTTSLTNLSTG